MRQQRQQTRQQQMQEMAELIARHGWVIQSVAEDSGMIALDVRFGGTMPGFCYSVGMTQFGHPEIVISGFLPELAAEFINDIGTKVRGGLLLQHGEEIVNLLGAGFKATLLEIPTDRLLVARQIWPHARALQLVWPDNKGRFPWQFGYSMAKQGCFWPGGWCAPGQVRDWSLL